jgi:hypothetical protein
MSEKPVTGGCQCGAVRFRAAKLGRAAICHCRMCQKAFGSFFGPLVTAFDLEWTRGAPRHFASSNRVRRGFCSDCGTPLTYEYGGPHEVAIGALDAPAQAAPVIQVNPADKLPFFDGLCALPVRADGAEPKADAFKAGIVSFQHPDHDTAVWPARGTP